MKKTLGALPPLSLYVHFPWCARKCPYCDFNSFAAPGPLPERDYVDALVADLGEDLPAIRHRPIVSVYLGGGTPSLFSPEAMARLLAVVRSRLVLAPEAELTLEVNPGTATKRKLSEFRALGINRLSLGIQSFQPGLLARIERIHDRRTALRAVEWAQAAGFENVNFDLLFGLPGQTMEEARADIAIAIDLAPAHVSYYQLTIEPGSCFFEHPPALPDEDLLAAMEQQGRLALRKAGYRHYEVSAHAQRGRQCRHNLNYWRFGDYLGIGAGSHSKITSAGYARIDRYWKQSDPQEYLAKASLPGRIAGQKTLTHQDLVLEFMLNALRLANGFAPPLFAARTGLAIEIPANALSRAQAAGFLTATSTLIRPTAKGRRFLNDLLQYFLPSEEP